jgi:hypothetical protein
MCTCCPSESSSNLLLEGTVVPAIFEQLTAFEQLLFLGLVLSGAYVTIVLWRNTIEKGELPAPLTASERRRVVLLLSLCGLCFAGLVTSLASR